jgi:hypothetical protein
MQDISTVLPLSWAAPNEWGHPQSNGPFCQSRLPLDDKPLDRAIVEGCFVALDDRRVWFSTKFTPAVSIRRRALRRSSGRITYANFWSAE